MLDRGPKDMVVVCVMHVMSVVDDGCLSMIVFFDPVRICLMLVCYRAYYCYEHVDVTILIEH